MLAAGTPYMTLHRLHAFISYADHTTWDFLVGTGPTKNALRITLDLYRGTAISEAPLLLGMKDKVYLPLMELTPPGGSRRRRSQDPRVCLTSEILDRNAVQTHPTTASGDVLAQCTGWQVNVGKRDEWVEAVPKHCQRLTNGEKADAREAFLRKSQGPWRGSMVHTWDANPLDLGEEPGRWVEQRLYVDKDGWARLWRLKPIVKNSAGMGAPSPGMVRVEFQRCHALKWVKEHSQNYKGSILTQLSVN